MKVELSAAAAAVVVAAVVVVVAAEFGSEMVEATEG